MPARSTLLQRTVFVAKRNLAGTEAVVTESKMLPDLDDGLPCEVDVVIEATVGGEQMIVSVEVKELSRPLDKNQVAEVIAKHARLPTNRLVIVSKSGFTKRALSKIATQDGKVVGVTPTEVSLTESPSLWVETFTMTPSEIVLDVRRPGGDVVTLRSQHGELIEIYNVDGLAEGNLEELVALITGAQGFRKRISELFHEHPNKEEVWGFTFEIPDFGELPNVPRAYVKWADTGELRQITSIGVAGDFTGTQSALDFTGLLLGDQLFGVARGELLGRPAVWVARQLDGSEARLSWHFEDAPPGT